MTPQCQCHKVKNWTFNSNISANSKPYLKKLQHANKVPLSLVKRVSIIFVNLFATNTAITVQTLCNCLMNNVKIFWASSILLKAFYKQDESFLLSCINVLVLSPFLSCICPIICHVFHSSVYSLQRWTSLFLNKPSMIYLFVLNFN